jgi:sugar lactone lactonase YvrE
VRCRDAAYVLQAKLIELIELCRRIAYRVDLVDRHYDRTSGLTNRRPFATPPGPGSPDGLTVDAEGGLWSALYDGGAVVGYSPDGVLVERVEVPTPKVTACTFGGEALDRLFITTSQEDVDLDADPLAGSLFVAEVGVRGRPVRPFAG